MKHIVMTGGGTAGHVTPNIALFPGLREKDIAVTYIGSYEGIEKELIEKTGTPYYGISTGKLRRYMDLKNLSDPFRVLKGIREASKLMNGLRPDLVFSKGGFVAVPVVLAAKKYNIPVLLHESDLSPGLANKICMRYAKKICCSFPETLEMLPAGKAVLTGLPIRGELRNGSAAEGRKLCGFTDDKPVLMVIGGSLGSVAVNNAVREALPVLLKDFQVAHLCGRGNLDAECEGLKGYRQFDYLNKELPDVFAAADIVVSRAGANAISELAALAKPNLLIPLPAAASRGDQLLNARSFEKQGYSMVLNEEMLTPASLAHAVAELYSARGKYIAAMEAGEHKNAADAVLNEICGLLGI